jgi:hypothetical protein
MTVKYAVSMPQLVHYSFWVHPFIPNHCWCYRFLSFFAITQSHTQGLYLQHTTLTIDKEQCPRGDSNPQSQEASGHGPPPLTARLLRQAANRHTLQIITAFWMPFAGHTSLHIARQRGQARNSTAQLINKLYIYVVAAKGTAPFKGTNQLHRTPPYSLLAFRTELATVGPRVSCAVAAYVSNARGKRTFHCAIALFG